MLMTLHAMYYCIPLAMISKLQTFKEESMLSPSGVLKISRPLNLQKHWSLVSALIPIVHLCVHYR